VTNKT